VAGAVVPSDARSMSAPADPHEPDGERAGATAPEAGATRPGPRPHGVVVISSVTSGEGSSTLALNLSLALIRRAGSVALVDGDRHPGDLVHDLGLERQRPAGSNAAGDELPVTEGPSGLLLVQAPQLPDGRARGAAAEAEVLRDAVTVIGRRADIVVVDMAIDVLVAGDGFRRAAAIVLVTTGSPAAIDHARLTAERLGSGPAAGLAVNEISRHPGPAAPEVIAAQLGLPLLAHLPYDRALDRALDPGLDDGLDHGPDQPGSPSRRRLVAGSHSHYTHAVGDLAWSLTDRLAG